MTEAAEKICKSCKRLLPMDRFERNQYNKNNEIVRRSECKECRQKAKKYPSIPSRIRRDYEKRNPPPAIGSEFTCPICKQTNTITKPREVNLDHDHITGTIRGYVCNRCNTGMGNLRDNPETIERAKQWVQGKIHEWNALNQMK